MRRCLTTLSFRIFVIVFMGNAAYLLQVRFEAINRFMKRDF